MDRESLREYFKKYGVAAFFDEIAGREGRNLDLHFDFLEPFKPDIHALRRLKRFAEPFALF